VGASRSLDISPGSETLPLPIISFLAIRSRDKPGFSVGPFALTQPLNYVEFTMNNEDEKKTMQILQTPQSNKVVSVNSNGFLVIKDVSKVYETAQGSYTVLDGVNLEIKEGEFICIIGHSGCGKSTLLNSIAGFNKPTTGEVLLEGNPITEPGPDRMVVFQNYSLLPWLSAKENIALAVETVYADKSVTVQENIVQDHLELVGLTEAAHKKPGQISGGMKQRVAIARALATRPKVLILDEPFGALDPITREELQEELLKIWREYRVTVLMITHDIDEALFLADRVVMMTNGPSAHIGEDLKIPFSRPRDRARIMEDPVYYELRNFALDFLFRRYAHHEGDEEETNTTPVTTTVTTTNTTPPEDPLKHNEPTPTIKPALKSVKSATTLVSPIAFNATKTTKVPTMSQEESSSSSVQIAVGLAWLAVLVAFTGVNIAQVNNSKKDTPTATASPTVVVSPTPSTLSTGSSPSSTSSSTPSSMMGSSPASTSSSTPSSMMGSSPASTSSSTPSSTTESSPSATTSSTPSSMMGSSPSATTSSTPSSMMGSSPSSISSSSPSSTTESSPPSTPSSSPSSTTESSPTSSPSSSPSSTSSPSGSKVTEQAQLDELSKKLYEQIDKAWTTTPTFTEELVYRVTVDQNGNVIKYEATNKAAQDFVKDIPLPSLQTSTKPEGGATQKTAEFQVTFSPDTKFKVTP